MQKKNIFLGNFFFLRKKTDFFSTFTASVRSRPPGSWMVLLSEMKMLEVLQGLGLVQAAVIERWP